jgi:hypothetical protein
MVWVIKLSATQYYIGLALRPGAQSKNKKKGWAPAWGGRERAVKFYNLRYAYEVQKKFGGKIERLF